MPWIESHDTIWTHHKTKTLCRLLRISKVQAVGHLISLWHFVLANAWRDADMTKWGDDGIEEASRWEGVPGEMVNGLRESGFLDGCIAHGWLRRAGKLVRDRIYNEERRCDAEKRRKNADDGRKQLATLPYPTLPNQQIPSQPDGAKDWFSEFYSHYPRKVGKAAALRAWDKIKPDYSLVEVMIRALSVQALSPDWEKENGRFIPHPATWLNGRRWEDQIAAPKTESSNLYD